MINTILMSCGIALLSGIIGSVLGSTWVCNMLIKVDKMYEETTGHSFVKWIFDTQNELRKNRVAKVYAAE